MAGLCEGGNEPLDSLKDIVTVTTPQGSVERFGFFPQRAKRPAGDRHNDRAVTVPCNYATQQTRSSRWLLSIRNKKEFSPLEKNCNNAIMRYKNSSLIGVYRESLARPNKAASNEDGNNWHSLRFDFLLHDFAIRSEFEDLVPKDVSGSEFLLRGASEKRLTGARYQDFLIKVLPTLLEYVPCQQRLQMWFIHEGTPAHFFRNEREHLTLTFQDRWINWGGPTPWAARSANLNPLDIWVNHVRRDSAVLISAVRGTGFVAAPQIKGKRAIYGAL
ncbi:hypothetical protein ANN_14419 [Periplaneta americana]|uniref:Uncharacterized protein n=1 Tax=Periplaneta americana TaxID=6978 RepID=A0ABQ8SW97_PERAM|nr:hypothetical protein ANN_14419 [Periplaneta americana]